MMAPYHAEVHPTGGSRRVFKQFSWLEASSVKVVLSRPAHQRVRKPLGELMGDPDPEKSKRVKDAMLKMQKIIVADLQKAYDG